jgi:beta-lactamase regulating signal transducer with metallopeptidase domain
MTSWPALAGWLQASIAANALSAMVLALLAWSAGRFVRRPAVRHTLWLLVLLDLLTPPVMHLAVLPPTAISPQSVISSAPSLPISPQAARAGSDLGTTSVGHHRPRITGHALPLGLLAALGSTLLAFLAVGRARRFDRLVRDAAPASASLMARVDRLTRHLGLRRVPPVRMTEMPVPPLVWLHHGFRPTLVLPTSLVDRLQGDELDAVLAHELAHIARRDPWVRLAELGATVLCWWHPALWWARNALRRVEEQACDARVVAAFPKLAGAYARGLVATVAFLAHHRTPSLSHATTADPRHDLEERLTMILRPTTSRPLPRVLRLLLLPAALIALFVIPVRGGVSEPQPNNDSPTVNAEAATDEREARDELAARLHKLDLREQTLAARERKLEAARRQVERARVAIEERAEEHAERKALHRLLEERADQKRARAEALEALTHERLLAMQKKVKSRQLEAVEHEDLVRQLEQRAVRKAQRVERLYAQEAQRRQQIYEGFEAEAARARAARAETQAAAKKIKATRRALKAKRAAGSRATTHPMLRLQLESLTNRLEAIRERTTSEAEAGAISAQLEALSDQIEALEDESRGEQH